MPKDKENKDVMYRPTMPNVGVFNMESKPIRRIKQRIDSLEKKQKENENYRKNNK